MSLETVKRGLHRGGLWLYTHRREILEGAQLVSEILLTLAGDNTGPRRRRRPAPRRAKATAA